MLSSPCNLSISYPVYSVKIFDKGLERERELKISRNKIASSKTFVLKWSA